VGVEENRSISSRRISATFGKQIEAGLPVHFQLLTCDHVVPL